MTIPYATRFATNVGVVRPVLLDTNAIHALFGGAALFFAAILSFRLRPSIHGWRVVDPDGFTDDIAARQRGRHPNHKPYSVEHQVLASADCPAGPLGVDFGRQRGRREG